MIRFHTVAVLVLCCIQMSFCAHAHDVNVPLADVPKELTEAVTKEFSGVQVQAVTKRTVKGAVVYFDFELSHDKKSSFDVYVSEKGQILSTGHEVKPGKVPEAIRTAVATHYAGWKVTNIEKEVEFKTKKISYSIDVMKDGKKLELEYAEDGTLVSEEDPGE